MVSQGWSVTFAVKRVSLIVEELVLEEFMLLLLRLCEWFISSIMPKDMKIKGKYVKREKGGESIRHTENGIYCHFEKIECHFPKNE